MGNLEIIEQKEREFALEKSRFEVEQRMAQAMINSSILPQHYRNVGDVMVLNEMSRVLNIPTVMLAQQLYVVKGKPAMSGQLVIAILNGSKRFDKPIMWEEREGKFGVRAYSFIDGEKVVGDWIDDEMIKANGWNSNPKWDSMKTQMARYRAASWFGRLYAPDVLLGFQEAEEVIDAQIETPKPKTNDLNAMLISDQKPKQEDQPENEEIVEEPKKRGRPKKEEQSEEVPKHDEETGEIIEAQIETPKDEESKHKTSVKEVSAAVAPHFPVLIQLGVNRGDLNDFVSTLNLNAANIKDFMSDPELVKDQIEKYYENMNQLPF